MRTTSATLPERTRACAARPNRPAQQVNSGDGGQSDSGTMDGDSVQRGRQVKWQWDSERYTRGAIGHSVMGQWYAWASGRRLFREANGPSGLGLESRYRNCWMLSCSTRWGSRRAACYRAHGRSVRKWPYIFSSIASIAQWLSVSLVN